MPAVSLGLVHTYAEQLEGLYLPWTPQGFPAPEVLQLNRALVGELGLDEDLVEAHAAELFSGNTPPADAAPIAQAYAGHQFGHFAPQLGDGRALLLGEVRDARGHLRDIQLKGSGPTHFSRGGDGKATLGPILREYLVAEAMHRLGVPTTRALAALTTGETIRRQEGLRPGAVLARVAASHIRVGTFEFFAARRLTDELSRLTGYTLARHYPDRVGGPEPAPVALLHAAADAQATLIARWMLVGFIHGVMNTDNTTLSGETIDYGPCAFMDAYDPATVFSSIDRGGRYAYANQPGVGQWNLARLGEALGLVIAEDHDAVAAVIERAVGRYADRYRATYLAGMRDKLGLPGEDHRDEALITDLLALMRAASHDYTGTFRALAAGLRAGVPPQDDALHHAWWARWLRRLGDVDRLAVAARMDAVNPAYIPRNHLVEEALTAAIAGDLAPYRALLQVLAEPFNKRPGLERYAEPAPADFSATYKTFCGT